MLPHNPTSSPEYPVSSTPFSTPPRVSPVARLNKLSASTEPRVTFGGHVRLPQNHKLLAFLPLVFVIGTEGFAMFAPYVMLLLSVAHIARRLKQTTPAAISIPV